MTTNTLKIRQPDDWHLHLRDGQIMQAVLPYSARVFSRAIVMPNLDPPVTTTDAAKKYRERILAALPPGIRFTPKMTCYLTDNSDPGQILLGAKTGIFMAAKLYPAGATTNSDRGVTDLAHIHRVLEMMQETGMPLLVHGEVVDDTVDIFDREAVFIDRVLDPLRRDFPDLKIVFEHVTSAAAVQYILESDALLGATITPHHLMVNRNAIFKNGLNPHMYCLPVVKTEKDRLAIRAAATGGDARFFLGTDSAPHLRSDKESRAGKAGIFNAPTALQCIAQVFEEENALDRFEAFVSLNGARFYGLPPNKDAIVLAKKPEGIAPPEEVPVDGGTIAVFCPPSPITWEIRDPE